MYPTKRDPYKRNIGRVTLRFWIEPDDWDIRDSFDPSCHDVDEIIRKVNRFELLWSVFFVTVEVSGIELGRDVLGGILWNEREDDPVQMARDNAMFKQAITEARHKLDEIFDFGIDKTVDDIVYQIEQDLREISYPNLNKLIHTVNEWWDWEDAAPVIRMINHLIRLKDETGV